MIPATALATLAQSNIPIERKTGIMRLYERATGILPSSAASLSVSPPVREAFHVVRQGGEALVTGGALGLLHANLKNGLDRFGPKLPIDGLAAAIGLIGSVFLANDVTGIGTDMRNIGSDALAIFIFRKTHDWQSEKTPIHGESEDPIVVAAKEFGT